MRFARDLHARPQAAYVVVVAALGLVAVLASAITVVGSDALWLPALGDRILAAREIPSGIPFAAAPSGDWVNTTAAGQLVLAAAHVGGSAGVVVAQVVAVVLTLGVLALHASQLGARPTVTALVIVGVTTGAAATFFIARAQLLSLVPFAMLLVLLRRQRDIPTRAIWWAVPLIAVWGNLHGAVLVGVALLGCYLLLSRLRLEPATAVGVGAASLLATCLNPGLIQAPRYYVGVLSGQATTDESGMWSRISLDNPFDVLLVLAAVALGAAALRQRRALWEYAAGLGLVVATGSAARHGVWLLLFLAVPAAASFGAPSTVFGESPRRFLKIFSPVLAAIFVIVSAVVLTLRAPSFRASDADAAQLAATTRGQVVLAQEPLVESIAVAGATVWVSNPLDAFTSADQAAYLAFMKGDKNGARAAFQRADVVVAAPGSPQAVAASASGFTPVRRVGSYVVLTRTN
ncbi:hypothetical protein [Terrabacter sp. NPDC080008]|uniref:hypothetical protein n=1 Tax=Terrabacter sp. NPDC080008 TaxID=3155176 RepID=UPI0034503FF3